MRLLGLDPRATLTRFWARAQLWNGFDESAYLAANQDVAVAVQNGRFHSGAAHWLELGRLEGRARQPSDVNPLLPADFSEAEYLARNPDLKAAIRSGSIASGSAHWLSHGRHEGRDYRMPEGGHASPEDDRDHGVAVSDLNASREITEGGERVSEDPFPEWTVPSADPDLNFDAPAYAANNPDVADTVGHSPDALMEHWCKHGFLEGRTAYGLTLYRRRKFGPKFWRKSDTITFYGLLDAHSGLGASARGYLAAVKAAGYDVEAVTIGNRPSGFAIEPAPGAEADERRETARRARSSKVNIVHLNADMTHRFFIDGRTDLLDYSYNIGIWFWELSHFRQDWAGSFGAYDEIWVSSEFARSAIAAVSPVPVVKIPMPIEPPVVTDLLPRAHFRLPEDVFLFGCIFDVGSVVSRKNPAAAISAFIDRFAGRQDVMLLMKYHSMRHYPDSFQEIRALAAGHGNIRFFGRIFTEQENVSFKAILDCLVSPHRSEGFGLNMAEAMLMEKPVIATGYSGSLEFADDDTSFPIRYRLQELGEQLGPYPPDALWAEPDVAHLAELMETVVNDPPAAAAKVARARRRILTDHSVEVVAREIKDRFDALQILGSAPPAFLQNWGGGIESATRFYPDQGPRISVIVPVYNIDPVLLEKCVESVLRQSYARWELVLYDDGSTKAGTIDLLKRMRGSDPRFKVAFGSRNRGISAATNGAIELSSGTFLAFLDNDDELAPHALEEMVAAIQANPTVDLLYSDEDKIDPSGRFCDHYFKPDWSPEHLESVMYILHLFVARRSVVLAVGGLRDAYSAAQDYDLALRVSRVARKIVHVPKVLYHWRKIEGSSAAVLDAKPIGLQRATAALQDHLDEQGRGAKASAGLSQGFQRVNHAVAPGTPVTLLLFTDNRRAEVNKRGDINLFDHFLTSIGETTETICELHYLVVDNGNLTEAQRERVEGLGGRVVSYRGSMKPFNFSDKANFAFSHVRTDLVVMLNDDMEVITPGWLDELVGYAQQPEIGVVGARLLFPDDRIQHCGAVLGVNSGVAHVYHGYDADAIGYNGYTHIVRNYLAVTGACAAFRMSVFEEVGGFDLDFAIDYNDIDFCLRVYEAGYRNVYTPFASLYHFEGLTASRQAPRESESALFTSRWRKYVERDPYYNPNLVRNRVDFAPIPELNYR